MIEGDDGSETSCGAVGWAGSLEGGVSPVLRQIFRTVILGIA